MSIQWTIIAGFLYFEIAVVIVLISPMFSPKYYNYFFRCRLYTTFKEHIGVYFLSLLGILSVFLMDSIREMQKYSHSNNLGHSNLSTDLKGSVKLFRAQRNFYITGFSIFLAFVIRRLITMFRYRYKVLLRAKAIRSKAEDAMLLARTKLSETQQLLEEEMYKEVVVGQADELETS